MLGVCFFDSLLLLDIPEGTDCFAVLGIGHVGLVGRFGGDWVKLNSVAPTELFYV